MRVHLAMALVVLLAVSAVSARHVPKHKAQHKAQHKTHQKVHHKMHADLERVQHAHRRNAVRRYLGKELEEQKDYLLALDCGSSGTKFMVYRLDSATCPETEHPCKDKAMKVKPGLKKIVTSGVSKYFALWGSKISPHFGGSTSFQGFVAKATAGNRIISRSQNATTWEAFTASVTGFPAFSGVPVVDGFGDPSTMPGTMEAWVEWKAANAQGNQGNFVSLGGASAQMAFRLTTLELAVKFRDIYNGMDKTDLECNNQVSGYDYFCIVEAEPNEYKCLYDDQIEQKCNGNKCVGLVSWLAGKYLDEDQPGCPLGVHHRTGGTDQVKANFEDWLRHKVVPDGKTGVRKGGKEYATACNEGSTAQACVDALKEFISGDVLLETTNEFSTFYKEKQPDAKWYAAGNMDIALHVVGTDSQVIDPATNKIKTARGAFFYCNGKSLVDKAGVGDVMERPDSKIDWLDSAAAILGYHQKCDLPRIDLTVSECETEIA